MASYYLSPEAKEDLIEIWAFIAKDNMVNADNYLDKLYKKILLLSDNQKIGVERNELANGLRCFPVDDYILYYFIKNNIELVRVLHSSRDIGLAFR